MNAQREDATELRRALAAAEERQREVVHHLRNVMAVVRALVRQPAGNGDDADPYRVQLEGRVDAFARVQSALLRDLGRGADLEDLVRDQLIVFGIHVDREKAIAGPAIRLDARATGLMALLIHELALGTLDDGGQPLSVSWQLDANRSSLRLLWLDRGHGARDLSWIERAFGYELQGALSVDLHGGERSCVARLPMRHIIAAG